MNLSLHAAQHAQSVSGDLRLMDVRGSNSSNFGRLEIYYSNQWGTVCTSSWSASEALVACRQLGFATYAEYGATLRQVKLIVNAAVIVIVLAIIVLLMC